MKKISNNYLIIIPIISLIGGIWQGQYTDDGYHWGFIFSNALDLIDGKVPYKEIFLEYGILTTIINSVILLIFNKNILSLMLITCIAYSLTIFLIALITQNFTEGKYYGFLSTIIIFMIYPWPVSPWPNFTSFFFTTLFCYLYLSEKKKYSLLAGTSLALAYLTFTTVYNIIIILFLLIILIFTAMGFYYKRSIEKTLGTMVQRYNEQKGLTFNYGSRPKQKSLEDGGESGATNCGENRREPSSSAPGDPSGH